MTFTSLDSRFEGSTTSHIIQHSSYQNDIVPSDDKYSLIKEANIWEDLNRAESSKIHVISKKPFFITRETNLANWHPYYTDYSDIEVENEGNNLCPAQNVFYEMTILDKIWAVDVDGNISTDLIHRETCYPRLYIQMNTSNKNYTTGDSIVKYEQEDFQIQYG